VTGKGGLHRSLRLRDLVFYGIVVIQPTAPMPMFGVVSQEARGHVVTAVLIAMVAMLLTAVSYGRMARVYPSAGSAYAYVSGEFGVAAGFFTGWSVLLEYLLNPLVCTIWCSSAAANFVPFIPLALWNVFFAALFTMLNMRGVESSARMNQWLAIVMGVVVAWLLVCMVRYLLLQGPHDAAYYRRPFYDPATFQFPRVSTGVSIAALTYIGFDSVSTLSEEAIDPHRDIMRATVLTCFFTGVLAAIQCYAGQLVWPDFSKYPDVDTAYVFIAERAGGHRVFTLVNATLLIATIGSGIGAMLGCARLLYGMSKGGALPASFSYIEPRRGVPSRNVLLCGAVALLGAWSMSYQLGCELLNFGAFLAFIGVNASAFHYDYVRGRDRRLRHALIPAIGGAVCLYIWWSLRWQAKAAGLAWLAAGAFYFAIRRRTDRAAPVDKPSRGRLES
jgi:putrescine importer